MKELLIFLAGLGVGGGVTYIALKGRYDAQLEEEVAELMDYKRDKKKKAKKASKRVTEASESSEEPEIEENDSDEQDREEYAKIVKANYDKRDPGELVKSKKNKNKGGKDPKIFLLSPRAFAQAEVDQETVILYKDGIVALESDPDQVVDNGYALLGGEEVLKEAEATGEQTVYIRNMNVDTDYEVIFADENYSSFSPDDGPEDG